MAPVAFVTPVPLVPSIAPISPIPLFGILTRLMVISDDPSGAVEAVVRFQAAIYSLDVIKKAAYRLSDRASCEIAQQGSEVVCTLRPLPDVRPEDFRGISDKFRIEVLDQDLRASIAAETEPLRNAILAYALSRADLPRE